MSNQHCFSALAAVILITSFSTSARGSEITVTVTGTITSGTDVTGVFGSPNTDLTNDPVTVTYNLYDTVGTNTVVSCSQNTPCGSTLQANGVNSPGSVIVQVNGVSVTFGDLFNVDVARYISPAPSPYLEFDAGDGGFHSADVYLSPAASTPPWTTDYNWEDSFFFPGPVNSQTSFHLGGAQQNAEGFFDVSTVTVNGLNPPTSTPEPAAYLLVGFGLLLLIASRHWMLSIARFAKAARMLRTRSERM